MEIGDLSILLISEVHISLFEKDKGTYQGKISSLFYIMLCYTLHATTLSHPNVVKIKLIPNIKILKVIYNTNHI